MARSMQLRRSPSQVERRALKGFAGLDQLMRPLANEEMEVKTKIETPSHRQVVRRKWGGRRNRSRLKKSSSTSSSAQATIPKWTKKRKLPPSTCLVSMLARKHSWLCPASCKCMVAKGKGK